jgi:serine phosphatase RsbU (regulator of sigma subunit)
VSCTLNIVSIDLQTGTVVLTRNNPAPIFIMRSGSIDCLQSESVPLGISRSVRPIITEISVEAGLIIILFTDGLVHAGKRLGQPLDVCASIQAMLEEQDPSPQEIADSLLSHATRLDEGRPADDISVVALKVVQNQGDEVRRMSVRVPINMV